MKANEVSLNSFLSQTKTQFIIPVYQRNYDWTEHQCSQLFTDILEVGKRQGETHFIGSIVFIHDGVYTSSDVKQLVVIDGQQRLTTFSLLYLALYKYAVKNGLEEKASEINETYLVNKFVKDDSSKLKLKQSDVNAKAFKFISSENDPGDYPEFSRLIENFNFFRQRIDKDNFETIENGLKSLLFVEISLERNKDDPQRIFESLNSTGLELSQADLIRNYILMGLEPTKQVSVFTNYWEIIEQNAKDIDKEESKVSDFIRDYLTYKTKKIPNKSKVYEEFKFRYSMRDDKFYDETLLELKEFSYHYNKLLNPVKETDAAIRKELELIKRLEINISFPFLMPVYEDYRKGIMDKVAFAGVLKLVQSYVWRRFIVGLPTNALNKIFMTLYSDVDQDNYLGSIEESLVRKKGSQRFPNNKDIETALLEKDVYNIQSKNRVYFLELLENHNNKEYVSIDNPNITIEHIFPQNPDEKWYGYMAPEEFNVMSEKYLNTIANLTLSGNNGSLSNKSFLEKKSMNKEGREQGYNFSRLWLNHYLKEIDNWNLEALQVRYRMLLDRFFNIWTYPDVEVDEDFDTDAEYTIYNSPEPRNRTIDYFIFRDEKIEEEEVSKMYYHVIKTLFEENPTAFNHQDTKSLIQLTTNPSKSRAPYPISSSYYVESNIDSNTKFRRLKALLTRFDCEEDLLIKFAEDGIEDEDDEEINESYWIKQGSEKSMAIVKKCEEMLKQLNKNLRLTYKVGYIGVADGNRAQNFVLFNPRNDFVRINIKVSDTKHWIEQFEKAQIKFLSKGRREGRLKFRLTQEDITNKTSFIHDIFSSAFEGWGS
ncbi:MAG: DUF262 domain-containing protein [Cyclobacteriaceae bacterium]